MRGERARTLVLLGGLYAAQGLPFGFFSLALPVLLREQGWTLTAISFLQFLALPWGIKFLWAPVVDRHGSRRTWLLSLQAAAIAMALLLSELHFSLDSVLLFVAVFLFNLIAATQDVVTDGLAVRLLNAQERGLANGLQVGAYRLGMILGGGLLLWVFAQMGWRVMFLGMAGMLVLTTLPVLWMREPLPVPRDEPPVVPPSAKLAASSLFSGWRLAIAWLHRALTPGMLVLAGLIFCYRFGDQMVSSLLIPFIRDQGMDKETIAVMKGTVGSATSLLGAAVGGWLTFRAGRRQALLWSGLAQAAGFGLYIAAAMGLGGVELLWAATVVEGVVGTMASVALFALMMDASDPAHAGTDYTLLASVVVAVSSLGGLAGGLLGDRLGYTATFCIGTALAAAGCVFLVWWLDRRPTHARVAQAWR